MKKKLILIAMVMIMVVSMSFALVGCDKKVYKCNGNTIQLINKEKAQVDINISAVDFEIIYKGEAKYSVAKKADSNGNRAMVFEWKDKDDKEVIFDKLIYQDKYGNIVIGELFVFKA